MTCIHVNPQLDQFWLIDYRIYDPTGDDQSKLELVQEMLSHTVHHKQLPFQAVLMDTWYATRDLMLFTESLNKVYYCLLKANRQVDDFSGQHSYQQVNTLNWNTGELQAAQNQRLSQRPQSAAFLGQGVYPPHERALSPTIWLKTLQRQYNRCMASVGKLSNCIVKASR